MTTPVNGKPFNTEKVEKEKAVKALTPNKREEDLSSDGTPALKAVVAVVDHNIRDRICIPLAYSQI